MCIDWSTDCLYPVKHSSNMNAFINHVGSKCEKLKASQVPPLLYGYFSSGTGSDYGCGKPD